jgi:hypothetical protein
MPTSSDAYEDEGDEEGLPRKKSSETYLNRVRRAKGGQIYVFVLVLDTLLQARLFPGALLLTSLVADENAVHSQHPDSARLILLIYLATETRLSLH